MISIFLVLRILGYPTAFVEWNLSNQKAALNIVRVLKMNPQLRGRIVLRRRDPVVGMRQRIQKKEGNLIVGGFHFPKGKTVNQKIGTAGKKGNSVLYLRTCRSLSIRHYNLFFIREHFHQACIYKNP